MWAGLVFLALIFIFGLIAIIVNGGDDNDDGPRMV